MAYFPRELCRPQAIKSNEEQDLLSNLFISCELRIGRQRMEGSYLRPAPELIKSSEITLVKGVSMQVNVHVHEITEAAVPYDR